MGNPKEGIRRSLIFVFLTPFTIGRASIGCRPEEKGLSVSRSFMQLFPLSQRGCGMGLWNGTVEWISEKLQLHRAPRISP